MKPLLPRFRVLCLLGLFICVCHSAQAAKLSSHGGTIVQFDFNSTKTWPGKAPAVSSPGENAALTQAKVGTVDVAGSVKPSGGLLFTTGKINTLRPWSAGFSSGKLPVQNSELNAKKLTLSFSLSASSTNPVTVLIESYNAAKKRTGGLALTVFPAAPNFYEHYALDLSAMKAAGGGQFRPADPYVQFSFAVHSKGAAGVSAVPNCQIRLDNVNYASAAYYVSPQGSDAGDGRSEQTAFATPQKALDVARPGDIVLLMDGTYTAGMVPVAAFTRPGTPAAWIVLKNYPGQHPTLFSNGWNIVSIAKGSKEIPSKDAALAYLEVRGLHVRGEGDTAKKKYPDAMGKPDPRINSNGISVDSRYSEAIFHDIRIADNVVEYCPGGGITSIDGDWITVENNISRSNCFTTIYAPSGISVMGSANFDGVVNIYKRLVRNNICCHNQTYEIWHATNNYSDGNGIILDVNQGSDAHPNANYLGRTLVQSNLSYDNGGSGIHAFRANRVDIVGNTAYLNSASIHLQYGEIFAGHVDDVRIMNNIMVAPVANVAAGEKPEPVNGGGHSTNVVFANNTYFGGNMAPTVGNGDVIADPQFVNASVDDKVADFHLKATSPALGKGAVMPFSPYLDLDGKLRGPVPSEGAYEK